MPRAAAFLLLAIMPLWADGLAVGGILFPRADAPGDSGILLIEDGKLLKILPPDAAIPPGFRAIKGEDLHIYPLWIDGFSGLALDIPADDGRFGDEGVDKRFEAPSASDPANRRGLRPQLAAWDLAKRDADAWKAAAEKGFGLAMLAPREGILAGRGALVALSAPKLRQALIPQPEFFVGNLRGVGGGYPATIMGGTAQLRQFLADVSWHRALADSGHPTAYDPALLAGAELVAGGRLWLIADRADAIDRVLAFAETSGLKVGLIGGFEAYRFVDRLRQAEIPVILELDWPRAPRRVPEDSAALAERRPWQRPWRVEAELRQDWELGRGTAAALDSAGVLFCLGSRSLEAKDFPDRLADLRDGGLSRSGLRRALFEAPAQIFEIDAREFVFRGQVALTITSGPAGRSKSRVRAILLGSDLVEFEGED